MQYIFRNHTSGIVDRAYNLVVVEAQYSLNNQKWHKILTEVPANNDFQVDHKPHSS